MSGPKSLLQHVASFRSITLIAAGNVAGQAITIGAAPILSRLYEPSDFGVFATVVAVANLGVALAPLALHQAMHIPPAAETAAALVRGSLRLTAISSLVGAAAAGLAWARTGNAAWLFVPLAMAAGAAADVVGYWTTREGHFRWLVQARLAGAIVGVAGMLALRSWHAFGLLAGHTLGAFASAAWLLLAFQRLAPRPGPGPSVGDLLRQFRQFPMWRLPATMLTATLSQMPLWIFSHAFGPAMTGQFSLTQRIFNAPLIMLGAATADVFQREAGQALRTRGECRAEFRRFAGLLGTLALAIAAIVAAAGPALFAWVFGEPWREAGELARWFAPLFALRFALSPLSGLLILGARTGWDLALQIWLLLGTAAAWIVALQTRSPAATAIALTAATATFYAGSTWLAHRIATGRLPAPSPGR